MNPEDPETGCNEKVCLCGLGDECAWLRAENERYRKENF